MSKPDPKECVESGESFVNTLPEVGTENNPDEVWDDEWHPDSSI